MTATATTTTEDRPYHMLLAEDSAADAGIVRIALRDQNLNHVLYVAGDGEEAIKFIEKADNEAKARRPDLLLLDMHFPKYEGEAILRRQHATMFYFRKPSRLEEFIEPGEIVREILTAKTPLTISAAVPAERGDAG